MGHQHVEAEQQYEHGGAVLEVAVQLPYHPAQPQQPHHLQRAEQAADALQRSEVRGQQVAGRLPWRDGIWHRCGHGW